jgi:ABC-type transport system involved in cytochrome c biogenesis permease subunit
VNTFTKLFPWLIVGTFALYAVGKVAPRHETYKEFDLTQFGSIPVLDSGRLKPLDSVARTHMLYLSGQSEFEDPYEDGHPNRPAILWLLELMASDDPNKGMAAEARVFKVDNENLKNLLKLPNRSGLRYSWKEITDNPEFTNFLRALESARNLDEKKRDLEKAKIIELGNRLQLYLTLARRQSPTLIPPEPGATEWQSLGEIDEKVKPRVAMTAQQRARMEAVQMFQASKMDPKDITQDQFEKQVAALLPYILRDEVEKHRSEVSPAGAAFAEVLTAYKEKKPKGFSAAIDGYKSKHVYPLSPELRDTTKFELAFNQAYPIYYAACWYVFALVMVVLSWLGWSHPLRMAAWGLFIEAFALHAFGLVGRMYITDRPLVFVTNLYSSALFIGFCAVACGLIVEYMFRNGVGFVVGAIIGAASTVIAHHLSTDGNDTMGSLVAVLDTNFWLASHVTTITFGYAATYLAGLMGVLYIVWGLFFTNLDRKNHQTLGKMTYGVICFATLLSFVGTVLGGIWADQSWGRFWGWDPKENGAVLIVIWNSLVLHARWGGMVKQRGVAVLAVVGIMVTTWSWFGTNQLGVGLHNYGFNKTLADGCMYTWIISLVVIGLGLIPLQYWRSYPALTAPIVPPPKAAIPVAPAPGYVPPSQQPKAPNQQAPNQQAQPNGQPNRQVPPGQQPRPGKKPGKRR